MEQYDKNDGDSKIYDDDDDDCSEQRPKARPTLGTRDCQTRSNYMLSDLVSGLFSLNSRI